MFRVDVRHAQHVREVHRVLGLVRHHIVHELVECLEFVVAEEGQLVRPRLLLGAGVGVVDPVLNLGHDAEVVAGALERPEEIWVLRGRDCDGRPVGQDQARGHDLVCKKSVLALEHAVAAA